MAADPCWQPAPCEPTLTPGVVHVWAACLDQPRASIEALAGTLAPEERVRSQRFVFDKDRDDFQVARGVLRTILARYQGEEPRRVCFRYGPNGKPLLAASPGETPIEFNISHSGRIVLCACALGRRVGVDVECHRPIQEMAAIVDRCLSAGERAGYRALPGDQQLAAFFRCWTLKESYLKARGEGLSRALDQLETSFLPGRALGLLRVCGDQQEAGLWSFCPLPVDDGHTATLAVEGSDWRLACWQWKA